MTLYVTGDPAADELLADDAFALLIGMVLDQQVPMERAFAAPLHLRERLGGLDAGELAAMDRGELEAAFAEKPALHRFPAAMAGRVHEVAQIVERDWGGDAAAIWRTATTGEELLARLRALPGFGEQKARIFLALLGKRYGIEPPGWREAAGDYGRAGTFVSVADIDSPEALAKVRAHKQAMKAANRSSASAGAEVPARTRRR